MVCLPIEKEFKLMDMQFAIFAFMAQIPNSLTIMTQQIISGLSS